PGITADHVDAALARDLSRRWRVLQGHGPPPVGTQNPRVAATRGTDVKSESGRGQAAQLAGQQDPALLVPPVPVLDLGESSESGCFHGATFYHVPGDGTRCSAGIEAVWTINQDTIPCKLPHTPRPIHHPASAALARERGE